VSDTAKGVFVVAILVASLIFTIFLDRIGDSDEDAPSGSSAWEECASRWDLNRQTAESPYMTRDRYIANCMETMRDIEDGRLGN